jgi:PAS domain S-box-containing protein
MYMANILIIDDDPDIRILLKDSLIKSGHDADYAESGRAGLDAVANQIPDLILLDLMMPVMDGYEFLDHFGRLNLDPSVPVIILTALNQGDQVVEGLRRGANDYVTKPFSLEELTARINVQLRIAELENQIRRSEAYHRAIFERSADPDLLLDANGEVLQANNAAIGTFSDRTELVGSRLESLIVEEERAKFNVAFKGAFEGSEIPIFEIHLQLPNGQVFPYDLDIGPVDIEGERLLLAHLRDIRRRMAAEARTAMIFEHIGDGVFITDHKGTIMMASRSAAQLIGVPDDEVVGQDITEHQDEEHSPDWEKFTELSSYGGLSGQGDPVVSEGVISRGDGVDIPVEWTMAAFTVGADQFFIGVARDLSDRRAAESRRMETERLETMLEIAGGAAHEINQPLTAILGYAEMSLVQLGEDHPVHRNQKLIADAAVRITEIVKRMQEIKEYRTRPYANGHRIVDFRPDGSDEE